MGCINWRHRLSFRMHNKRWPSRCRHDGEILLHQGLLVVRLWALAITQQITCKMSLAGLVHAVAHSH